MIIGLHHAQITIPKGTEEEGKQFYCGILGVPEKEKPESLKGRGGFWIKVGDRDVHIETEDDFDRLKNKSPFSLSSRGYCLLEKLLRKK